MGGVELAGDGDEAVVILPKALALQAQPLGNPVIKICLVLWKRFRGNRSATSWLAMVAENNGF